MIYRPDPLKCTYSALSAVPCILPSLTQRVKIGKISRGLFIVAVCLVLSGCAIECKDKPGVIVRGDWSVELNRTKAIQKTSETTVCDSGTKSRRRKHHFPCGRFGCLKCALAPSTGEIDEDDSESENETGTDSTQPNTQNPTCMIGPGGYPIPLFAGGPIGPLGGPGVGAFPAPPPIPVINPNTGQRLVMQPVLPGQPGMLMLNAATGQPIVVNPVPPQQIGPGMIPQVPGLPNQTGMFAGQQPQMGSPQMGMGQPGAPGMSPQIGALQNPLQNPMQAPLQAAPPGYSQPPAGLAMVNPATGMPIPGPYAGPYAGLYGNGSPAGQGMYAQMGQNMNGNALYPGSDSGSESDSDSDSEKGSNSTGQKKKKSPMPLPKFHSVPTHSVYQRTEGIAKQEQKNEEDRLRKIQLERVLGTKVPEGTKISPNGVNQQLIQTSSGSGSGGGSANSNPFFPISGLLGPNATSQLLGPQQIKQNTESQTTNDAEDLRQTQQTQIMLQKQQLKIMKKQLDKLEQEKQAQQFRIQQEAELRAKLQAQELKKQSILKNPTSTFTNALSALTPKELLSGSQNKQQDKQQVKSDKQIAQTYANTPVKTAARPTAQISEQTSVQASVQPRREIQMVARSTPKIQVEPVEIVEQDEQEAALPEVFEEEYETALFAESNDSIDSDEMYEEQNDQLIDEPFENHPRQVLYHNHTKMVSQPPQLRQNHQQPQRTPRAPQPMLSSGKLPYSKDFNEMRSGGLFDTLASRFAPKPQPHYDARYHQQTTERLAAQRAAVQRSLGMNQAPIEEPSPIKQVSRVAPTPEVLEIITTED